MRPEAQERGTIDSTQPWEMLRPAIPSSRTWLVTGAAGFIGSHLVETLLSLGQSVRGVDDFSTGHRHNLEEALRTAGRTASRRFEFVSGDLGDPALAARCCENIDYVLHQADHPSVEESVLVPLHSHRASLGTALGLFEASRKASIRRLVFASSSAVYGDQQTPHHEGLRIAPISPYGAGKAATEAYASAYFTSFGLKTIGLRYFNVFGPRQDTSGQCRAVVPAWLRALSQGKALTLHGSGEQTRNLCYVGDIVRANILAAVSEDPGACGRAVNVGSKECCTMVRLATILTEIWQSMFGSDNPVRFEHLASRTGDIHRSQASVSLAASLFGYQSAWNLPQALALTVLHEVARSNQARTFNQPHPGLGSDRRKQFSRKTQ